MRASHSIVAFTLVGVACWVSMRSFGSSSATRPPAAADTASTGELPARPLATAEVAALKRELAHLRLRTEQLEHTQSQDTATEPEAPAPSSEQAAEEETPEQARAREQREFAEYFGNLDRMRESQSVDRTWEDDIANRLRSLARDGLAPDSTVEAVQCGTTLCRIEVSHGSLKARQLFARDLTRAVQSMASIQWLDNTSVVYIARDDGSLPEWPETS